MVRIQLVLMSDDITNSLKPFDRILCFGTLTKKVTAQIRPKRAREVKNRTLLLYSSTKKIKYAAVNASKIIGTATTTEVLRIWNL